MSGIQEILVILGVIFLLLFLPRSLPGNRPSDRKKRKPVIKRMNGMLRLGVVISIFWLAGTGVYFRPWDGRLAEFMITGGAPVAIGWGIWWVAAGFRKSSRSRDL